MEKLSLKQWLAKAKVSAPDVTSLIRECTRCLVAFEEERTQMDVVRFKAITQWVADLRKADIGDTAVSEIVSSWIQQSHINMRERTTNLVEILSRVGAPVVQMLLPLLMQKHPEWFNGQEEKD